MMKIKLPCEIIEDLLPSYVDGLTNPTTTLAVSEHMEDCENCRNRYQSMKGFDRELSDAQEELTTKEEEQQEIKFLKKTRKVHIGAIIGASVGVLILAFAYFVFASFNGSIIKKTMIKNQAKKYIAENFADRDDLVVISGGYDFKNGYYMAYVESTTSRDTRFTVYYDKDGKLTDNYDTYVANLSNTEIRLMMELDDAVDALLLSDLPYQSRLLLADYCDEVEIDRSKLYLDMPLDLNDPIGPIELTIWVGSEQSEPTWEEYKSVLRTLYNYTEEKGLHVDYFSVTIEYPYETDKNGELVPTEYGSLILISNLPREAAWDDALLNMYIEQAIEENGIVDK